MMLRKPGLHAFTGGCDSTSAFVRKGKVRPFKILQQQHQFVEVFQKLGSSVDGLDDDTVEGLHRFVCCLYGKPSLTDPDQVRYDVFKARYEAKSEGKSFNIDDGIDLSLLPTCVTTLKMHIMKANYQDFIWKQSNTAYAHVPSPVG